MPTRVIVRFKRASPSPLVHERDPIAKKQRTNDLCGIRIKSETETGNTKKVKKCERTIIREEIDDGSTAAAGESFFG